MKELNKYFDHTMLKPEATTEDIKKLCKEAIEHNFYSVCVNSGYVNLTKELLKGTDVKITSVVGFPLGTSTTATKVFETEDSCKLGASEVDMVLNVGRLKSKDYEFCKRDIEEVVKAAKKYNAIVKVILETCLLTKEEIKRASEISIDAGADFIKTSTGFNKGGATVEDVRLMKQTGGEKIKIKASGGIRDYSTFKDMVDAGADRIGASAGVEILKEAKNISI